MFCLFFHHANFSFVSCTYVTVVFFSFVVSVPILYLQVQFTVSTKDCSESSRLADIHRIVPLFGVCCSFSRNHGAKCFLETGRSA